MVFKGAVEYILLWFVTLYVICNGDVIICEKVMVYPVTICCERGCGIYSMAVWYTGIFYYEFM
jgi:hypothetical protein